MPSTKPDPENGTKTEGGLVPIVAQSSVETENPFEKAVDGDKNFFF